MRTFFLYTYVFFLCTFCFYTYVFFYTYGFLLACGVTHRKAHTLFYLYIHFFFYTYAFLLICGVTSILCKLNRIWSGSQISNWFGTEQNSRWWLPIKLQEIIYYIHIKLNLPWIFKINLLQKYKIQLNKYVNESI